MTTIERRRIPIDYTSRDFDSLRAHMLEYASAQMPEWTSRNDNDFGVMMVELMAVMGDLLSYYTDRAMNEAFLQTAVLRRSILNIARMLDYDPSQGAAATVSLTFTTQSGVGIITIPECTQVSTVGSSGSPVIFEVDEDLVIDTGSTTTGVVSATEGTKQDLEALGTSNGDVDQVFRLGLVPVIEGSVEIYVNEGGGNALWREVERLIEADAGDAVYELRVDEVGGVSVLFGDNISGKVPLDGSSVSATYRVGGGSRGNVPADTLVQILNSIPGVISVTNPLAATGGADPETMDQIRRNAPRSLRTIQRAVTIQDHADLALRVDGVAKASSADTGARAVTVYVAPAGGGAPTAGLKTDVEDYIEPRMMVDVSLTVADPVYVGIDIGLDLVVLPNYVQSRVEDSVNRALLDMFLFNNVDFQQRVTLGAIYQTIVRLEGVSYVVITKLDNTPGTGLGDVVLAVNEIPQAGTFTFNTSGGLTP